MPSQNSASFFGKVTPQPSRSLLSSSGRLGRLSYIARLGLCQVLFVSIMFLVMQSLHLINWNHMMLRTQHLPHHPFFLMFAGLVLLLLYSYFITILMIQRLHDLNHSGWISLLSLIPVINLILMLYLFLARGTPQLNDYGLPQPTSTLEKLCAWLMIVFFLAGCISTGIGISNLIESGALDDLPQLMKHNMQYF